MPAWGNTDNHNQKPKWDFEREVREFAQLTVATGNTVGNTIITVTAYDGGPSTLANIGVAAGQYVYFWPNGTAVVGGESGNGVPGMFESNTTVASVSGNTVTLAEGLYCNVLTGSTIEFDKAIVRNSAKTVDFTYNSDTVLATPTRIANTEINSGGVFQGWVHVQKKVNNDGTIRYIRETLVALANAQASNTASGNTSWGTAFPGV